MDVPDQRIDKMDLDVEVTSDTLILSIPEVNGEYVGKYNPDSAAFFGYFKQSGIKFPLKLIKGEENDLVYFRPQKPKKPYPYIEEEVTVENKPAKLTLAGTFTKPEGKGPFPAVILITGSGPEDRDETILGHKPFLILADYLTRKGFAVLRCDDRGTAKSTGDFYGTSADYATDAVVQLEYLKTRKDVDAGKIGLLGHSEGGIIAPLAAAPRKDVAFLVLYAAPAVDLYNLLLVQDSLILASEERSQKEIADSREKNAKNI
jgi:dipeptidyl aminopeptidase/acylaminoacyl peptidase